MKSPLRLVLHSSLAEVVQQLPGTPPGFFHDLSFCKANWLKLPNGTITMQEVSGSDYTIWQWNFQLTEALPCYIEAEHGAIVLLQPIAVHDDTIVFGGQPVYVLPKMYFLFYVPAGTHLFTVKVPSSFLIFIKPPLSFLEGLRNEVPGVNELIQSFLQQQKHAYLLPNVPIVRDSWMRLKRMDVPTLRHGIPDLHLRSYIIDVLHDFGKAAKQQPSSHLVFYTAKQKAILLKEYLDEQLFDPSLPSLTALAKKFYTEPRALTKAFDQLTGQTIPQYILTKRLAQAHSYIVETNLSVMEIAFRSGFNDVSHFIRSFKKVYGSTPGHRRENKAL